MSTTTTSDDCNGASKSNDDGVCEVNDILRNISTNDDDNNEILLDICANCGKEGSDVKNTCNKCNMVIYCNAACKKKHRSKHKKACDKRVAELHDEKLFKQPPLLHEDCPICFLRMPTLDTGRRYKSCCGKIICNGCSHAPVYDNQGNKVTGKLCAFCRIPVPESDEEVIGRMKKPAETGDPIAIFNMGVYYYEGLYNLPQHYTKALDWYQRAAELGHAGAQFNIGITYIDGGGIEVDKKKAKHYYELAAMQGDSYARHNLGVIEFQEGNMDRATKHFIIAVEGGYNDSLNSTISKYFTRMAMQPKTSILMLYELIRNT